MLLKMYIKFQDLLSREDGQDMVEYALLIALVGFGATAALKSLATNIGTALATISTTLTTDVKQ